MPFGLPLDDLNSGHCYEIYLVGKSHPLTCIFIELLTQPGGAAKLLLKPVRSQHPIRLSVRDIEAIQPSEDSVNA